MLSQSKEVQDAWRAPQRTLDIKVVVNDKSYTATDINSLKYDSGAYTGDTFAIGSTYSNTVQIEFSHLVEGLKLGMEVHPSIGIKTSSGYVYEPLGVFIISSEIKMDRNNNLTTISASDRFCGLEGAYKSKLTYPAKVLDVITEICAQSGVKANTDDLSRLPHQEDLPTPITGQSYRKALGWIAQLYAGYATFDRQGLFTIRTVAELNYELDPSQYEQAGLIKNEAPYKLNGIQCQVTTIVKTRDGEDTEETKTYQVGDSNGTQVKLENNIMTPTRLDAIWEQLKDITFYPFSLNWFGNPAVEVGDWLRLKDKQGNSFVVPNNSYTLDFNGGLSATSKADQTTASDQMTPWQGSIAQAIKELQVRRAPNGTVIFPPSVTEPPQNAKFNDVWFKKNGNATELWVFEKQSDGSGKWVRKDLSDGEIRKIVDQAQSGLIEAKQQIEANKKLADQDIERLNKSVGSLESQYGTVTPDLNRVSQEIAEAMAKYQSAKQTVSDLRNQAVKQGKDIADITKTVDGLNINYANLLGDVNATKIDVKGLQTTLGTANGDINQLKIDAQHMQSLLAGKADNSTYTNFVNLTNQALQGKLTASDLNGYAKTVDVEATANGLKVDMNSVTDRLNNLKIGGRNLILNSATDIVVESKTTDAYPQWDNHLLYSSLQSNTTYTFSVSATNTNGVEQASVRIFKESLDGKYLNKEAAHWYFNADGKRHNFTFTTPNDAIPYDVWLYAGPMGTLQGKDFTTTYHHPMLQIGNAGTEWSPNPQDIQNDLSQLSARITTTSQQFSSYYTKSETDNKANTAKNDAINAIHGDGNWQGLNNILTNSGFLQSADGFLQKVQQTFATSGDSVNLAEKTNQGTTNWSTETGNGVTNISEININGSRGVRFTQTKKSTEWWVIMYALNLNYFEPDQDYVISFDIRTSNDVSKTNAILSIAQVNSLNPYFTDNSFSQTFQANKLTHVSVIKHTNKILDKNGEVFYFNSLNLGQCDWVDIVNLKIAKGRIDKGYSQAPSDNTIAFSELSQSLEGLQSNVTNFQNNTNSQFTQLSNVMQSKVGSADFNALKQRVDMQTLDSADINNMKTSGHYFVRNLANSPISGWVYVDVTGNGNSRIRQDVYQDSGIKHKYRRWFGNYWTGWEEGATYTEINQLQDAVNVRVQKGELLSQINLTAGNTLIQTGKLYLDSSSVVFSGNAFIPSAAITSLNADKITTGTLNATNVNIINLNANNITTGTLSGSNGQFYLDSGSLHIWQSNHDAWIDQNGIHDYDNSGNNVWIKKGSISIYGNTSSVDMRDGEIYFNKKNWVTDNVLASDYGSITKADNVFNLGTSGLSLTGTDGFLLKTSNWNDGTLTRMGSDPINGTGIAGNKSGFMQLAAGKQLFLYAGDPISSGGFRGLPHLVLDGTVGDGKTGLSGYFSSYNFTSTSGSLAGGLQLNENSITLNSLDGKNGLYVDANSATLTAGNKHISIGGMFSGVNDNFNVVGNFTVTGSKNAIVPTSRGMAAINAYETTEYYFGDIGESATNSNGEITIMIDPFFLETVNTIVPYQVFLTAYGDANVWITSRSANCFVVKSSKPNIHFAWEIKAKRKGYENDRMEIVKGVN